MIKDGDLVDNPQSSIFNQQLPERAMGFEPTTFSLARRRTTAVLRPHHSAIFTEECRETESN
jgi:hypothetical protein